MLSEKFQFISFISNKYSLFFSYNQIIKYEISYLNLFTSLSNTGGEARLKRAELEDVYIIIDYADNFFVPILRCF